MNDLSDAGIGYVVVSEDLEKHFFSNNYIFDPVQGDKIIQALKSTTLIQEYGYNNLAVFKNNRFTMKLTIPPEAVRQQHLAIIGFIISLISVFGFSVLLLTVKKP